MNMGELNKSALQITLDNIEEKVSNIEKKLEYNYVTKDQFEPVKKIVYGLVGLILTSVVVALLAVIITKKVMMILNKIAYFVIILALGAIGLAGYWLIFPYKTLEINTIPVLIFPQAVKNGGAVVLAFDRCNYTDKVVHIESQLISEKIEIDLPSKDRILPMGCIKRNIPVSLPRLTNMGDYKLKYKFTYQLNPLKKKVVEFETDTFPIEK